MALWEGDVSGQGFEDFGGSFTSNYALVFLRSVGDDVRFPEASEPDHFLRAGWFSLGYKGADIDGIERWYWDRPIYVDFVGFRWHPEPAVAAGGNANVYCSGVRWHFSAGVVAHLLIGAG